MKPQSRLLDAFEASPNSSMQRPVCVRHKLSFGGGILYFTADNQGNLQESETFSIVGRTCEVELKECDTDEVWCGGLRRLSHVVCFRVLG